MPSDDNDAGYPEAGRELRIARDDRQVAAPGVQVTPNTPGVPYLYVRFVVLRLVLVQLEIFFYTDHHSVALEATCFKM